MQRPRWGCTRFACSASPEVWPPLESGGVGFSAVSSPIFVALLLEGSGVPSEGGAVSDPPLAGYERSKKAGSPSPVTPTPEALKSNISDGWHGSFCHSGGRALKQGKVGHRAFCRLHDSLPNFGG